MRRSDTLRVVPQLDVPRLEALGFFRHTRPDAIERLRREPDLSELVCAPETHRAYHADAEELAEGDVRTFLGRVAPFLRREGVAVDVVYAEVRFAEPGRPLGRGRARLRADGWLDEDGPDPHVESMWVSFSPDARPCEVTEGRPEDRDAYVLLAGDREIVIWDDGVPPEDGEDDWSRASRATLAILDELLTAHGSAERAYAMGYGNDLTVVFATPEMGRVINAAAETRRDRLHDGAGIEAP
jgi:hypothetical protein